MILSPRLRLLATFLLVALVQPINAQFYAPNTESHDPVQRFFVVEAARVLAWWTDPSGTNIAEVSFDVTTKPDQSTVWDLRWLDSKGKAVKTTSISYPASLLKTGADFYRSIFKQLWLADWRNPPALDPGEAIEAYWKGAAMMTVARESSLEKALELVKNRAKLPDRELLPELAGLLTHAALHASSEVVSLDRVLQARGAAWLAFTEKLTSRKLDPLWSPILFQAYRERAAAELWQASALAKSQKPTPQQQGWDTWLRKPVSKDVFLFAVDSTNLPIAMPMLAYDVNANGTGKTLAEVMEEIVEMPQMMAEFHNYAPVFAVQSSIGGGHIMGGSWAVFSRLAYLRLLSAYQSLPHDFQGYQKLLTQVTNALGPKLKEKPDPNLDPSLLGFREVAPLLRLGSTEGIGKLIPVPVVTARDLLNYGWEMAGWQMGSRYKFVNSRWGVHELADPIYKTVTTEVEGLTPFFKRGREAQIAHYGESLKRLQLVEGLFQLVGFNVPFTEESPTIEGTRLFVKRCWLRPADFEWQARALWDTDGFSDIPDLILALREEAGTSGTVAILAYLSQLDNASLRKIPKGSELKYSLADSLHQSSALKVRSMSEGKFRNLDNFSRAQEYERMYWENPDSGLEGRIIFNYIVSGGFSSAQRFYSQARSNFEDSVSFSNGLGQELFVLGYCINDAKLRQHAMEDSRSGSYSDMLLGIWEAAIQGNVKDIEKAANEIVQRYEDRKGPDSQGNRLLKFLPLLPALKDPKHPSRREALEYFGRGGGWMVLRFIWIEKYNIPTEDAILFLGGRENNLLGQFLIDYLEKKQPQALDALNQLSAASDARAEQKVLVACLYSRMHPLGPPHEDKDLKPPGAMSIRQAVMARLQSRQSK